MLHDGKHRWAMSWPGNYCVCCGQDDITESAICCPDCEFFWPDAEPDWAEGSIIKAKVTPEVFRHPNLCATHQALADIKCPCTKEHEDGWRM